VSSTWSIDYIMGCWIASKVRLHILASSNSADSLTEQLRACFIVVVAGNIVFVMAGTNNIERHTASEVVVGVQYLVDMILAQKPNAQVVVFGMLPRDKQKPKKKFGHVDLMRRVDEFNQLLAQNIRGAAGYRYFGQALRGDNGLKNDAYYEDYVHLNKAGYRVFFADLCEAVAEWATTPTAVEVDDFVVSPSHGCKK
jgi:lysophospholipase L1-like esterase